jgi:hypothetical protein
MSAILSNSIACEQLPVMQAAIRAIRKGLVQSAAPNRLSQLQELLV